MSAVDRLPAAPRTRAARLAALLLVALASIPWQSSAQEGETGFAPRFGAPATEIELGEAALTPLEQRFVDAHRELKVAIFREGVKPFVRVAPDGEITGHAIDLLQALGSTLGFRLRPVVYDTWPEVLEALRTGQADLTPLAAYTAERDAYLDYTRGIFPNPVGLMTLAGDGRLDENGTLEGVRVAIGEGFVAASYLPLIYPEAIPVPVGSVREALERMRDGEADAHFGAILEAVTASAEAPAIPLRVERRLYYGTGWNHIAVREDLPLLAELFDKFTGDGRTAVLEKVVGNIDGLTADELRPLPLTEADLGLLERFETLRVGTLPSTPLLNGATADGRHTGIAAGFTAYASHELGVPIEIVRYDSIGAMLDGAEDGAIDLIPLLPYSPAFARRLTYSTPYFEMPWVVVGRIGQPRDPDLEAFSGGRIGLVRDNPIREEIGSRHADVEIVEFERSRGMLQALDRRDVDAAVMLQLVAAPLIHQSFDGLQVLGNLDAPPAALAFAAPPATAALVPLLDRALARMDPALADRLVRRWIATDFEPARRLQRLLRLLVPTTLLLAALWILTVLWNRRVRAESRRRLAAEQRLRDMTDGLETGVFQVFHARGRPARLLFANETARRLMRLGDASSDGSATDPYASFVQHIHPEERERVQAAMRAALGSGEPFSESFRFDFPWRGQGWILAEASARAQADGASLWNGYLFDLTDERRLSENLGELLEEKKAFVAMAGHELRTPAQNVALALEALGGAELDATDRERLGSAGQAVADLQALVDDLVDMSSMDLHELSLQNRPVRLHELLRSAGRTFTAAMEEKGLTFECRIGPGVPDAVETDPMRLRQILYNLVGNAVKYTDRGGVALVALVERDARDGASDAGGASGANGPDGAAPGENVPGRVPVTIEVRDTGIGIPERELERVFEPFSTIGPVSRRSTGLGLAVCSRLVAVMEGRMEVESEPGRGSTFRVRLPLEPGGPADAVEAGERDERCVDAAPVELAGARVLLVDDDRFVRATLAELLRREGLAVEALGDASAALARLDEATFTALVTDHRMPGMSGLELAREVRRRARAGGDRPVLIGMTGGMSSEDAGRSHEAFDALLVKPVAAAQVRRLIATARARDLAGTPAHA